MKNPTISWMTPPRHTILPTPHSHTAAPSLISGMGLANGMKPVLPPYSPALPVGSPYLYPFGHIRRELWRLLPTLTTQLSTFRRWERLALQMQIYALNTAVCFLTRLYSFVDAFPWTAIQFMDFPSDKQRVLRWETWGYREVDGDRGNHGLRRRERSQDLRPEARVPPPPRIEHTQPRDTSSELSSGGETAGKSKAGEHSSDPQCYAPRPPRWDESADDEDDADIDDGEWIDEDVGGMEGIADELLQLEFHTDYVGNPEKCR